MTCSGCCQKKNKVIPLQEEYAEETSLDKGPIADRSCRDVVFLIIFILYICGMGVVAYFGISKGNPYRIIYGMDSWGNVCSQQNEKIPGVTVSGRDMRNFKYNFFLDNEFFGSLSSLSSFKKNSLTTCVSQCPNVTLTTESEAKNYMAATDVSLCRYDVTTFSKNSPYCAKLDISPQSNMFFRCIPNKFKTSLANMAKLVVNSFSGMSIDGDMPKNIIADLRNTWKEMLYLSAVALGASLLVVLMMSILAAVIIWVVVLLTIALSLGVTGYCWYIWHSKSEGSTERKEWLIWSAIASAITVILLLVLLAMRKRISLVVQLFKEAGKAIRCLPFLLLQPVWTLIFLVAVLMGLAVIATFIETSGLPNITKDNSTGVETVSFVMEEKWKYVRWYHLFGILWISAFIVACQDVVMAGAVATWFFSRDKKKLGWPILTSTKRLIRYHIGSVAFGSFIIALVRFARLLLAYVQRKLKGKVGKIAEFLLKMLQCCLWCFEKFLAFLNRNAYIEIAIYGYGFCRAAQKAFLLIVANALRVAAINSIGDFVLFLGKLVTVAIVMVAGCVMFKDKDEVIYKSVPIAVGCAVGFAIAHCFLLVYEVTIDTIFLCFCEDCERNDGQQKPYYMSKNLMKYLSKSNKAIAATQKQDRNRQKEKEQNDNKDQETRDLTTV